MENTKNIDILLDKKLEDNYSDRLNMDNFLATSELTVTITLKEYRKLVEANATREADIKKAESDKYERTCEIRSLKEEIERLKSKIVELTAAELKSEDKF